MNWTENGTEVSTDASYTFAVTANRNLLANFRLNSFSILTTANPSEGGSTSGSGTFNFNTSATVVATANTGYSFVNWTENGTEVSTEASYTFAVRANRSLLATFDVLTSIEDYEKFSLNIYPNPGTKTLYVSSPSIQIKQIRIFENSGKLVFVKKYSSNQISINILNLAPGGYFIEISSDRQSFTRKFFKE